MREWLRAIPFGAGLIFLAGCGGGGGANGTRTSTPTPLPVTVYTPAPTPAPTLNPAYAVGQTVTTTTEAAITVVSTAPAQSGNQFETPPPGGSFFGAQIKECAGNQVLYVAPSTWSVKLADATQIDATFVVDGTPTPALQSTNLNPGSCTAGWIYFPLPAGAAPVEIHLLKADFYWTLH